MAGLDSSARGMDQAVEGLGFESVSENQDRHGLITIRIGVIEYFSKDAILIRG